MASKLEHHAEQLAALGSPVRVGILRLLVQGDPSGTPVGEIQSKLEIPWSTLSHHLARLAETGLLRERPEGRFIYYSVDYPALRTLTNYLWEDCCKGGAAKSSCC